MHHCNKSDLAGIFGVTIPTIDHWVREGMPVVERSERKGVEWKFETSEAINWRIEYSIKRDREGRKKSPGRSVPAASDDDPIRAAQARKLIAEAEIKEVTASIKKGEVARMADFERVAASLITASKTRMLGLPTKCAPLVALESNTEECRRILEASVREALEELADMRPDLHMEVDEEESDAESEVKDLGNPGQS